ncbi:MAG: hypothetical protein II447_09875, partial [Bacteroidaceae bacterium]|nr:hypothetical protein [Bacteroidaceae bacterium]
MKNEERRIFHENKKMKNIFKNIHIVFCLAALFLVSCGNPQKELKKQLPGKADIISELKQK